MPNLVETIKNKPWLRILVLDLGFYLLLFGTFAAASAIDAVRGGRDIDVARTLLIYSVGFGHWLLLFPPIYYHASTRRFMDASVASKIGQAAVLMSASMGVILTYLAVVGAPVFDQTLDALLKSAGLVQWLWDLVLYVFIMLAGYLSGVSTRNREAKLTEARLAQQLAQQRADLSDREAEYLRGRLGSHFVMNALSNLVGLMRLNRIEQAEEATILLSDILRSMTGASVIEECITLEEEFEDARKYLAFQKIRFPSMEVNYQISDPVRHFKVPRQLLQPILENVFKHGPIADGVTIKIEGALVNDTLQIMVRNNSEASHADIVSEGQGMQLTRLRLEKACGKNCIVRRAFEHGWYQVVLEIPVKIQMEAS